MRARAGRSHGADRVYVEYQDLDRVPARIVGWDVFDDVALIKVDPQDHALAPVPLGDSSAVAVGEPVAAIGSPFGKEDSLGSGRRLGHAPVDRVADLEVHPDRRDPDRCADQPRQLRRPALRCARPRDRDQRADPQRQRHREGVGFAVPIDSARRSMQQLVANGKVSYAYVGITTSNLTPAREAFRYGTTEGAAITTVMKDSPAGDAGLHGPSRPRRTSASSSRPTPM